MQVYWEKIYSGAKRDESRGTNFWGDDTGGFEFSEMLSKSDGKKTGKFSCPIRPIPWSQDFEENVSLTLEWLLRDNRHEQIRFHDGEILHRLRADWFVSDFLEGSYIHACYPQDLLKFRTQYEGLYGRLSRLPTSEMSTNHLKMRSDLKELLWSQWKCFGQDGRKVSVKTEDYSSEYKMKYNYKCSRCGEAMPKAVKAYTILTQSKLKDCI